MMRVFLLLVTVTIASSTLAKSHSPSKGKPSKEKAEKAHKEPAPGALLSKLREIYPKAQADFGRVSYITQPGYIRKMDWPARDWSTLPEVISIRIPEAEFNAKHGKEKPSQIGENLLKELSPLLAQSSCPDIQILKAGELNKMPPLARRLISGNLVSHRKGDIYLFLFVMPQC